MGSGASKKCKASSNDATKDQQKNNFFASAMHSLMNQGPKTSLSRKPEPVKIVSSYTDDIDIGDVNSSEDEQQLDFITSENELEKREENDLLAANVVDQGEKEALEDDHDATYVVDRAEKEALNDDHDAFDIVIGNRASLLDDNVKDISIYSFSVSARGKELLKDTSLKISHGKRYGLVGPNGTGKSTLLKLLAWGKIPVPKNIDVLLVEQEVVSDNRTALQVVLSANQELVKIRKEVDLLQNSDDDDAGEKLAELYEKLQVLESDSAEAEASKILSGLGFSKQMQNHATRSFSSGWRMRISLAKALFVQPTLLLLDKPTNNLDLRAVLWLQEFLCSWKKTIVIVSHDRDFLNSVCGEIIHLHDLKLNLYRGVFEDFEKWIEQRRVETNKKFEIFDKQVKAAKKDGYRNQLEKAKGLAKTKSKGKLDENDEAPKKWKNYSVQFHFPQPTLLKTESLIRLNKCNFSYLNRKDFRLSNINVGINMDSRVAIVGPNSAGKSTLLNLLSGDLVPTKGELWMSQNFRIGRYSQNFVDLLTMEETPVQYLLRLYPNQEGISKQEAVRSELEKFGLPSHNHVSPISKLSDGQRARVVFTSISMLRPHVLILDRPTNHLDMESIDALALALHEFKGGVVLVSHDSRLISNVCKNEHSTILVVENGTVKPFKGTFDDYKDELLKEI